jgi:hypothetical protein
VSNLLSSTKPTGAYGFYLRGFGSLLVYVRIQFNKELEGVQRFVQHVLHRKKLSIHNMKSSALLSSYKTISAHFSICRIGDAQKASRQ